MTSQLSRARNGRRMPAGRSASIGGIRPAWSAGSRAAARVTSVPTPSARATDNGPSTGPSMGTMPDERRYQATAAARPVPRISPSTPPGSPRTRAWTRTRPLTWRRVAPAARSRPTSRTRSETVIDRVLKMRNAPANKARAAISALVAWKSIVDARIVEARSAGVDRMYGSPVSRCSSSAATASVVAPAPSPISTREAPSSANIDCASASPTTTVRPSVVARGPFPDRIPTIGSRRGSPAPRSVIVPPRLRPAPCAIRSVMSAPTVSPPARPTPATMFRSCSSG